MSSNEKLREALEHARDLILPQCNGGTAFAKACGSVVNEIFAALALPFRNCDVGTADEQEKRFIALCNKQHDDCFMCPVQNNMKSQCDCKFVWSQMPYETVITNK